MHRRRELSVLVNQMQQRAELDSAAMRAQHAAELQGKDSLIRQARAELDELMACLAELQSSSIEFATPIGIASMAQSV